MGLLFLQGTGKCKDTVLRQNRTKHTSKNCGISNYPLSLRKALACIQLKIFALLSSASLDLGLLIPAPPSHCLHPHHLTFFFSVLVSAPCLLHLKVYQSMCLHYIHLLSWFFFFFYCSLTWDFEAFIPAVIRKAGRNPRALCTPFLPVFQFNEAYYFWRVSPFLSFSSSLSTFDSWFTDLQILFIISVPTRFTLSGVHFCRKKITKKPHPPPLWVIATFSALAQCANCTALKWI